VKRRELLALAAAVLLAACAATPGDGTGAARRELAGTGTLRLAIEAPPAAGAAELQGIARATAELGADLARILGVPLELVRYPSTGELTNAAGSGAWDVAFLLVDPEREKLVDFGPGFVSTEIACLVAASSGIRGVAELDRPGTRLAVIRNTTTQRTLSARLQRATLVPVGTAGDQYEAIRSGTADAAAASRRAMEALAAKLPGARVLPESLHATTTAIAVPRGRPAALAYASDFLEKAKISGSARRALDDAGLKDAVLAPPSPRSGGLPGG